MLSNIKTRKTKKQVRKQRIQKGGAASAAGAFDANNNNSGKGYLNAAFNEMNKANQTEALLAGLPSPPTETPLVFPSTQDLPPVPVRILVSLERIMDLKIAFKYVPSIKKLIEIYTNLHFKIITTPIAIKKNISEANTILQKFNTLLQKENLDNGWRAFINDIIEDNKINITRINTAYNLQI